jgi:hypothetical protein
MKKIQGSILIILTISVGMARPNFAHAAEGKPEVSTTALAKADSLFHVKQYTQSFELYHSLFEKKQYSNSMLLKMAYIQEGLGHIAQSMYYLNLYYLVTNDPVALNKLDDVASKNKLEGYASDSSLDAVKLFTLLKENYGRVVAALCSICIFLISFAFYQKMKRHHTPVVPAILLLFFLALLFVHGYFSSQPAQGIISSSSTYLMEGPSAGSSVIGIVGEGHRVEIIGKKDVWLKVKWTDKEVYVKESEILPVRI